MPINDKKISFIIYSNDKKKYDICRQAIDELVIPDGYYVEKIQLSGSDRYSSMDRNLSITNNDAKYKVYVDEDVCIIDEKFILKMLEVFLDTSIGCFGYLGATKILANGTIIEHDALIGSYYHIQDDNVEVIKYNDKKEQYIVYK